ncbi:MAG TPA: DUF6599 family protein [Bryobacteraceae bacterium]
MSRSCCLALLSILLGSSLFAANDQALWKEYGLAWSQTLQSGADRVTAYRMKEPTGAIAAWEWLRTEKGQPCTLGSFCTAEPGRTVVAQENYVLTFDGPRPKAGQYKSLFATLPKKHDTALPSILDFLPRKGLVPGSARYILGPASYLDFAPELAQIDPGFGESVEAQAAEYRIGKSRKPVRLVLFSYPAPDMARQHLPAFQKLPGVHVKRSFALLAIVPGSAPPRQAQALLSQVQYKANIVMDAAPPTPSPVQLAVNLVISLLYLSGILCALCFAAGLMCAGMRLFRRRYGMIQADESLQTLGLGSRSR